jgi:hypothetical protein
MKTRVLALILALGGAARAQSPQEAFARIDKAKVAGDEARGRIATVVRSLTDAGMPRSATVLLAALAADDQQSEGVREAARAELAARAADDPGLAQLLLAQGDTGKLPPALAVRLARAHLERALELSPVEEGVAFETPKSGPALQDASAEPQPLDKDLAAEMGQASPAAPPQAAPRSDEPRPQQAALRELDRARALVSSVPAGDSFEGDAHEVAGLAALAAGDNDGATKEFLALAQLPAKDTGQVARRDKAFLQLARLAYQSGDDARATALYQRVGRMGPEWLDALFEASWAHFRRGEDEKALGNLLTLHAPFFQSRYFPESFVLKAVVLYQNCRYADARATLADFQRRYQPLHDGLAAALQQLGTPQAAADFLVRGPVQVEQAIAPGAREEVARLEQEPDVLASAQAAVQLAQEIDSLDRRSQVFRDSALMARVAPLARQARIALLETAGQKLLSRLSQERAELRELLGQSLRLSYEIAGREKELANDPAQGLANTHRDPAHVTDDEEIWPFQGEYWRDELGSYRYQLGQRCKKPRTPPQTASEKQEPPPAVAGEAPAR